MPLIKRTRKQILQDAQNQFDRTGNNASRIPGTPEHAITQLVADEVATWYNSLHLLRNGLMLSTATAADLDRLAELVGVRRREGSTAYDDSQLNVQFSITTGETAAALASQIGQNALTIPAGTEVNNGAGKRYLVTEDATFGSNDTKVFVKVIAAGSGPLFNAEAGELTRHNLSAHPTLGAIAHKLTVTNLMSISNGEFPEDDDSLRYRITQAFASQSGGTVSAIVQAARSVPGVADAFVVDNLYGTGTFGVFIESSSPIVSPGLLGAVQAAVDVVKPAGTRAYVQYPEYVGCFFKFEMVFNTTMSDQDLADLKKQVINHVNNLPRGSSLSVNKVLAVIGADRRVADVSLAHLKTGLYDIFNQKIINPATRLTVNQPLAAHQKWFTSSDLIDICKVQ
jgi:uncharacterized phage protein gp47/JayE